MPVYEYACDECGRQYEVTQRFSDPLLAECSLCGSPKVRKLLSPPSFVLKGSGWYVTDYASADRKKAMESEKPDAAPSGTGCSGGSCASGACPAKG